MRVQRGPDWQWSDQDGGIGHQGTVLLVKEWKGTPMGAARVHWDDDNADNSYRYGGENCYDLILSNPVSHKDYRPLQGVEYPAPTSWAHYCNLYLSSGLAKSRGLFHTKVSRQRLQLMLPAFDLESTMDEAFVKQAVEVIREVLDLGMQDISDFFEEKRSANKPFERNVCSQAARMDVLFPFQIYLFSQVQGDLEHTRTETNILATYLEMIYVRMTELIRKAERCYLSKRQSLNEILRALQSSVIYQLVPFIMTCLYVGSLDDDIMIAADNQISEMVQLWTHFLTATNLTRDAMENDDDCLQTALFSKTYCSIPSSNSAWYFALLYILVAADSRYITGLAPAVVPLTSQDELLLVWTRSYILSGGLAENVDAIEGHAFLSGLYNQTDHKWKTVFTWMECHYREAMWKSKMYRNPTLEFRLFIVLVYLSRLTPMLQDIYQKLQTTDPSVVSVPEEMGTIWKGVQRIREHLRSRQQDFKLSKDLKGLQRSTSFTMSRRAARSFNSLMSESESDSEEIKLDASSYLSNDRLSYSRVTPSSSEGRNSATNSDGETHDTIDMHRSQSDTFRNVTSTTDTATTVTTSPIEEAEYSEFDPELAESFKSLREIEKNYMGKLDLLMRMNQPVDVTVHELAYQYPNNNLDVPFTRKTIGNTAPPELDDDDLPESITETIVQSVHAFLLNTPSLGAADIENHLLECIQSAKDRAQAYLDSIEILTQLKSFPQASRLYLLGVQSALISTPNAATYRSRLSQLSPFTNSLDEIQMADFMANINGVEQKYVKQINTNILSFCEFLMRLCENCVDHMRWRLGTTVLWILSCDFNNTLIYNPFYLHLPAFYQTQLKKLSAMIGEDVLISAGPYWDANCQRVPSKEVLVRGKDGNPFVNSNGERMETSLFSASANSTPRVERESPFLTPPPLMSDGSRPGAQSRLTELHANSGRGMMSSALNSLKSSVKGSRNSTCSPQPGVRTDTISPEPSVKLQRMDPTYGCFSTAVFALANSLRISYGLLIIRQFYDHQLKLKQSRPQHMNTWSLDDVFMVFGYDSPRYFQCTRGMFNEFMEYFQYLIDSFERRCRGWKPFGLSVETNSKRSRHGCFRYADSSMLDSCKNDSVCPERGDLLVSSGESLLSYYLSLITWVLQTYIGGMIDWQLYGDTIWRMMYGSPRLRKLAVVCLQSIVPYTDYLPSMLEDKSLYTFLFSKKEVEKMPSSISTVLSRCSSSSNVFMNDEEEEDEEEDEKNYDFTSDFHEVDPRSMSTEEKEQAFIYYLLHLCVHDDFCFGAMTEERLACAQCCPFFPYIYQRLSTEIVEEEDAMGRQVNKHRLLYPNPPSLQPKSLKTRCKMLIRPEGYGASHCNLVVAEEVVYLLRSMLESERWKVLILDIFEVILERAADQIAIEKKYMETNHNEKRSENKERERIVWYSMGSAVLKVMGSISRRLYAGCRVRVRQQFMDHITDLDVLIQTIHQSSGTGYVIDYNINSGEVLVLLDQMQVPKLFTIYTLDVVDKVSPPANLSNETRDFLITHVQRVIINLEYPDELFELPGDESDMQEKPFDIVELQNLVLEQNAIYVFHQLMISFPESVRLLSKEFISVMLALALKPAPAKGIFGTEFIRYCFNHLAEQLIDTYPGCPHLYKSAPQPVRAVSSDPKVYGQRKPASEQYELYQELEPMRLKRARKLQEVLQQPLLVIYKALRVFHDNETTVADYLLEHQVSTSTDASVVAQHVMMATHQDAKAAVFDFDCSRSSPLFSGQSVRNIIAKKTQIMHSVPYFAQLEPVTMKNIQEAVNTIASKRGAQLDVVYPIDPTGVVTKVEDTLVTLTFLDTNSGISKQVTYPYTEVAFHKRRFGNAFTSVSSLRRMTARICLNLDLRLLRELIITLLYLFQKENVNVFKEYDVRPQDIVSFTKLIHVFYSTIASKSYIPNLTHLTPASALTYILKQTLIMMIKRESTPLLLPELMKDCWTVSPFGTLIHPLNNTRYYVESLHPYCARCKYHDKVLIPKAQALRIIFDDRCCLQSDQAFITFYRDSSYSHVIGRFTGGSDRFRTLHVQGNSVYYAFESVQDSNALWGYGFVVEALTGLSWSNDMQTIGGGCFDWINWELELLLDVGEEHTLQAPEYFNSVVATIIRYVCTYGAPYKSRAVELLLRLLSEPQLYTLTHLPDISSIQNNMYRYMPLVRTNKVPPEVRLMLEMCISFELYGELRQLKTPDDASQSLPPFVADPPRVTPRDTRAALRDVHRLARNLYYGSLPDESYLCYVCEKMENSWDEEQYRALADVMRRFSRQQDVQLMNLFHQKCVLQKVAPSNYDIASFFLTQEDIIRYNMLECFTTVELQQRLTLIRLLNMQLSSVIQFIDLMDMAQENRLGTILCAMSEYIDPETKESVLELSIKETQYDPKDSRPVIILDSMLTYEDPDDSTQRAPILFNESVTKNAFTSQCTFAQMFREVMKIDTNILRSPLDSRDRLFAVKYKGEQGLDFGGLYRDTIERW